MGGGRDALPGQPQVRGAWGDEAEAAWRAWNDRPATMQPIETVGAGGHVERLPGKVNVPPLAVYSSGQCNAYLDGGPYDGQITWVMAGEGVDFAVKGVGTYRPTETVKGGRVVYVWAGAGVDVP